MDAMRYRNLGNTGLKVSEIGFGCGNNAGLMTREAREEQTKTVRLAIHQGINYFDTSSAYGNGRSELNLGQVLKELKAEVIVSTKVRLGETDLVDLRAATIGSVEASLERLGRDSVHLIQLHTRPVMERKGRRFGLTPKEILGPRGVMEGFKVLRDRGKVQFFGFSGLGDPEALGELVDSGGFQSFQVYYNLLNPTAGQSVSPTFSALDYGQIIDRAAAKGMGAVVIRVLAGGALTPNPEIGGGSSGEPMSAGSDYETDLKRAEKLQFLLDGEARTLVEAAIRFALMKAEVSTVLVGISMSTQVQEAVRCSGAGGLSEKAMAQIKELWEKDFK